MMVSLKLVLDRRRIRKNGTYPLSIRVSNNRQSIYYNWGLTLHPQDYDSKLSRVKRCHSFSSQINIECEQKMKHVERLIDRLHKNGESLAVSNIKKALKKNAYEYTFFEFAMEVIEELNKINKCGTARTHQNSVSKLRTYAKTNLKFEEIDYNLLLDFQRSMLSQNIAINTISVYMRSIRSLFNQAIRRRITDRAHYPFNDFKIQSEQTRSRSLTIEHMRRIRDLELNKGCAMWRYRLYFMLLFYLRGMSFIDLAFLKRSNIENDRIVYKRRKTNKWYSIGITEEIDKAIKQIVDVKEMEGSDFILPIITNKKDYQVQLEQARQGYRYLNKNMKKIAKLCDIDLPITSYYARYSWANIARAKEYSKDLIAEGLGHEYGNKVTGIYLDQYPDSIIDQCNADVIGL